MKKSSKSEALKKHLGNVVCTKCGSKKHSSKDHSSEKPEKGEGKMESEREYNKKSINGDQE